MPRVSVGTQTPDSLGNLLKELEKVRIDIDVLKTSMEVEEVPRLEISGHSEMVRALERLAIFAENGRRALREFIRDRGDWGQGPDATATPEAKKAQPPKKPRKERK